MSILADIALDDARRKGHDMEADSRRAAIAYWVCRDCGLSVQESGGVIYGDAPNESCGGESR